MLSSITRRVPLATVALLAVLTAAGSPGGGAAEGVTPLDPGADDLAASLDPVTLEREREAVPHDRYAMAGGCYAIRSSRTGSYLERNGEAFAASAADLASAEPVGFQAFDLGKYLLHVSAAEPEPFQPQDFVAVEADPLAGGAPSGLDAAQGALRGTGDETLNPIRDPVLDGSEAAEEGVADARGEFSGTALIGAADPGPYAEWIVRDAGGGRFTIHRPVDDGAEDDPGPDDTQGAAPIAGTVVVGVDGAVSVAAPEAGAGPAAEFAFEPTVGCPEWPEVEIGVSGEHPHASSAMEEVRGYLDAHLHVMAFEFLGGRVRCGRPWHPYGVAFALVDCPDHEPGGSGAVLEQVLSPDSAGGHDTEGWPGFPYWPRYNSLTHEQVYYGWLERAWRGGLRMFTNLLVDNGVLCEVYPYKQNSCNEMDGVRLQAQRLRELERYIDAQWGGPGRGWFRIVTNPFDARRVMNEGRLAVVIGIEVSVLLDCGEYLGVARCTTEEIDKRLDEIHALGVRQLELVNKFDNALSGVTGDGGTTGPVVNSGNWKETGHWWRMHTCRSDDPIEGHAEIHDKTQPNVNGGFGGLAPPGEVSDGVTGRDALAGAVLQVFGDSGVAPVYPDGPHCNSAGLTDLGKAVLAGVAERGMIFDPDHMSARGRHQALDFLAQQGRHGYGGVVSSHGWADDVLYRRIYELGGVVTPYAGGASGFVATWAQQRPWMDDRFVSGFGWGADMNGFGAQGGPRDPEPGEGVSYPFRGFGGVVVNRQRSGEQEYDINTDGVDHYGLYPDWIEDVRIVAETDDDPSTTGTAILDDLAVGPEAYLQMWERAVGLRPDACRRDVTDLTVDDVARVRKGDSPAQVLVTLGQPHRRVGSAFTYCTDRGLVEIGFDGSGHVEGATTSGSADRGRAEVHALALSDGGEDVGADRSRQALAATGALGVGALGAVLGLAAHASRRRRRRPAVRYSS